MIEASVWIAPSIWNSVSESTERSVAETIPTESECCSPKGLPIAATGWPTTSSGSSPSSSGCRSSPSGSTSIRATSANGSKPTIFAETHVAVGELDVDGLRPLALAAARQRVFGDDVGVGDDPAVGVEDEARALGGARRSKIERIVTTPGAASS